MANRTQRLPDGRAVEFRPQDLQKQDPERQADWLRQAEEALRRREEGAQVDADAASALAGHMGNAAVQALLNRGTESDTATGAAEAAGQEEEQEEEAEEAEEREGGEVERVLPSFASGATGAAGGSPWAMGRYFGGDDDDDPEEAAVVGPRWRPQAILADPDEDEPIDEAEREGGGAEPPPSLAEAEGALGSAAWRASVLGRGLRFPERVARPGDDPAGLDGDPVVGRAGAMLRFLAEHAPDPLARALGRLGSCGASTTQAAVLSRRLALAELALSRLPPRPRWEALLDVAADVRARPRAEHAAARSAAAGSLSAPRLLLLALETEVPAGAAAWRTDAHPAAEAAVALASRAESLPHLELWSSSPAGAGEDDLLALLDRMAWPGGEAPSEGIQASELRALFDGFNRTLGALGAVQVEAAAAGLAVWPWVAPGPVLGLLSDVDEALRAAARRLVRVGREVEQAVGTTQRERVTALSAEAVAVRNAAEAARQNLAASLGAALLPRSDEAPALPAWWAAAAAGRRRPPPPSSPEEAVLALAFELASGSTADRTAWLAEVGPGVIPAFIEALWLDARGEAAGAWGRAQRGAAAAGLPWVTAACAIARREQLPGEAGRTHLLDAARLFRELEAPGPLNLLKLAW